MASMAYFHRLGYTICEPCRWIGNGNAVLADHLEADHGEVAREQVVALRNRLQQNYATALAEGRTGSS